MTMSMRFIIKLYEHKQYGPCIAFFELLLWVIINVADFHISNGICIFLRVYFSTYELVH